MTAGHRTVGPMNTTTMTTTTPVESATGFRGPLPVAALQPFQARAGDLDRANTYFAEDLAELRSFGYLAAAVPVEHGGWGLDLAELSASQRRLARYAPATALAMSMHSYWVGDAADFRLVQRGADLELAAEVGRLVLLGRLVGPDPFRHCGVCAPNRRVQQECKQRWGECDGNE